MHQTIFFQAIEGMMYYGQKTKQLVQNIPPQSIVLLDHQDIDELAALTLIEKQVKAVLNLSTSLTGTIPALGTLRLLEAQIPVFDVVHREKLKKSLQEKQHVHIEKYSLTLNNGQLLSFLLPYTEEYFLERFKQADESKAANWQQFVRNSLSHANEELDFFWQPLPLPPLRTELKNKQIVIVTRGRNYREDLHALGSYIKLHRPVLIGVDGGADALVSQGYVPDLIIGDMDSVSRSVLQSGAELVIHAYQRTGQAPGVDRIKELPYHLFPCCGTSEDAAYQLAYHAGAAKIISVGSHTSMADFLEKGRKGMGSSLLVRMLVADKLIDAKGVHLLLTAKEDHDCQKELALLSQHSMKQYALKERLKVSVSQENGVESLSSWTMGVGMEQENWLKNGQIK